MTEILFRDAPLKTVGGTTSQTLNDLFSSVVDVADFADLHEGSGSFGTQTGNDSPCFQYAFDMAFHNYGGTPEGPPTGVPHGLDYAHLNRPVRIPPGRFSLEDTLVLNKVVGGHIFGAGKFVSKFLSNNVVLPSTPMLYLNGCSHLCVEKMYFEMHSFEPDNFPAAGTSCIHLDWDEDDSGNGCLGNHHNHLQEIQFGGGHSVAIIGRTGDAGSEGNNTLFLDCNMSGGIYGLDIRGPAATNVSIRNCGGAGCYTAWIYCPSGGGSMHCEGWDTNNPTQSGTDPHDFLLQSNWPMTIGCGRSESPRLLKQTAGITTVHGVCITEPMTNCIELNGGKCLVMGNDFHGTAQVIGTGGELYLFGTSFFASTTPLSGYSGTVVMNPDAIAA